MTNSISRLNLFDVEFSNFIKPENIFCSVCQAMLNPAIDTNYCKYCGTVFTDNRCAEILNVDQFINEEQIDQNTKHIQQRSKRIISAEKYSVSTLNETKQLQLFAN